MQLKKKTLSLLEDMNDSELKKALLGKSIGIGSSRCVHDCKLSTSHVVKFEYKTFRFDNVAEWLVWDYFRYAEWYKKWLAEVVFISKSGRILIQEKIEFPDIKYPALVPNFFTDIRKSNFGFVGDQLKACDYAASIGRMTGLINQKMRKAKWL